MMFYLSICDCFSCLIHTSMRSEKNKQKEKIVKLTYYKEKYASLIMPLLREAILK